jgi:hypothetical protein
MTRPEAIERLAAMITTEIATGDGANRWRAFVDRALSELGAVFPDDALVEAVERDLARSCQPNCFEMDRCRRCRALDAAVLSLADDVLAQRRGRG